MNNKPTIREIRKAIEWLDDDSTFEVVYYYSHHVVVLNFWDKKIAYKLYGNKK